MASAVKDEDSPYLEACASVSNVNDPEMPALALRMWVIGLVLCMIGSGLSIFFNFCALSGLYSHSSRTLLENS